jgi:hypothetical protein
MSPSRYKRCHYLQLNIVKYDTVIYMILRKNLHQLQFFEFFFDKRIDYKESTCDIESIVTSFQIFVISYFFVSIVSRNP